MNGQKPTGWSEPFLRGLWSYDHIFGAPRFLLWFTVPAGAAAVLIPSIEALYALAIVQGVGMGVTLLEPEWAMIARDFLKDSGEVEP